MCLKLWRYGTALSHPYGRHKPICRETVIVSQEHRSNFDVLNFNSKSLFWCSSLHETVILHVFSSTGTGFICLAIIQKHNLVGEHVRRWTGGKQRQPQIIAQRIRILYTIAQKNLLLIVCTIMGKPKNVANLAPMNFKFLNRFLGTCLCIESLSQRSKVELQIRRS